MAVACIAYAVVQAVSRQDGAWLLHASIVCIAHGDETGQHYR